MVVFMVIINNNVVDCNLKILDTVCLQKFGRKVYAYLEIYLDNLQISGNVNVTIKWPPEIYKHIINPSNLMFEVDNNIVIQHSVSLNTNEITTTHIVSIPNNSKVMNIYIFSDIIPKMSGVVVPYISGVEKGNQYYTWLLPTNTITMSIEKCKNETEVFGFINAKPCISTFDCNKVRLFGIGFFKAYRSFSDTINLYSYSMPTICNTNISLETLRFYKDIVFNGKVDFDFIFTDV